MRISYAPEAREDLRELKEFIAMEYQNPKSATEITQKIMRTCSNLKRFPRMGMRLSEKIPVETPLRFLICGKHFVFYRIDGTTIRITRILDGRSDYIRILFGDLNENE